MEKISDLIKASSEVSVAELFEVQVSRNSKSMAVINTDGRIYSYEEFLVRTLLALVPTTFRWGTGADCGYELKLKLYRFLSNDGDIVNDDTQNQANSDPKDESTGTTGP